MCPLTISWQLQGQVEQVDGLAVLLGLKGLKTSINRLAAAAASSSKQLVACQCVQDRAARSKLTNHLMPEQHLCLQQHDAAEQG
jgi:hypothetical protein